MEDLVRYTLPNGDEFGVQRVHTDGRRCLFISDIHGEAELLLQLLDESEFCSDDLLFILGDICEKGTDSLKTLRCVMDLCARGNVFALQGNCDVWNRELNPARSTPWLGAYLAFRSKNLVADMCREQGIQLDANTDLDAMKRQLWQTCQPELHFLDTLPRIIETDRALLVHASIQQETPPWTDNAHALVKFDDWAEKAPAFQRWIICGHTPVINYCNTICDCKPLIDSKKHIISIDGGNVINRWGQLNALVVQGSHLENYAVDRLPFCRATGRQESDQIPVTTNWFHAGVEILKEQGDHVICRHLDSGRILTVPAAKLYRRKGDTQLRVDTWTDYLLPVEPGDLLKLCETDGEWCICKKDGVIGQVRRDLLVL